jgi:hypothetical protein
VNSVHTRDLNIDTVAVALTNHQSVKLTEVHSNGSVDRNFEDPADGKEHAETRDNGAEENEPHRGGPPDDGPAAIVANRKQITAFITYAEDGEELADDMRIRLKRAKITPVTWSMIEGPSSSYPGWLDKCLHKEIDFFIPIITPGYLQEILSSGPEQMRGSITKYIYEWCALQYTQNNCKNWNVKPVIESSLSRNAAIIKRLKQCNLVLQRPFCPWDDFQKYVNVLKMCYKLKLRGC